MSPILHQGLSFGFKVDEDGERGGADASVKDFVKKWDHYASVKQKEEQDFSNCYRTLVSGWHRNHKLEKPSLKNKTFSGLSDDAFQHSEVHFK